MGKSWLAWSRWSLTARLMAGSGAALIVSAVILVYSSVKSEVESNRTLLQERLADETDFVLPTITEQAVVGDYANIERLLKLRVKRAEINRFAWIDEQGNKIEAVNYSAPQEAPDWFVAWVDMPPLQHTSEVAVGGVRYGEISFELTPLPMVNRLWQSLLDKLQLFILGVGIFFAVIIQILHGGLEPLYRLASGARRLGQGDYSVRLPAEGAPEMLESIRAFNNMADGIEQLVTSLRESEARKRLLATIVEQSDQAIFTTDLAGRITSWNPGAEALFGYTAEEAIGREYSMLVTSEDRPKAETTGRVRAERKRSYESRMVTRSGTIVDIEVSAAPLYDDDGMHAGEITIARDITERKRTQEQLIAAKKAAEAASQAKSDFVANMSHEIRTPMNGILGFTELALDSDLSPEQRENLHAVKSSAESLLGVINDILDFSKIEAGRLDIESIPFSLRDNIAQTMKSLELRAHQKGLKLSWAVTPQVMDHVIGDPVRLRQVIVNLAGNAIKFTDRGEVELRAELQSRHGNEARLLFSVRDTGIGIPQEKRRVIFEAFSQADMSTTRLYGGTGLGLTIASRLVDLMGGRIAVESEPGKGSIFRFDIKVGVAGEGTELAPIPATATSGSALGRRAARTATRPLQVLVAEDNPVNQKLAVRLLEKLGHRVQLVENGEQAVATAKVQHFDALLLDVQMPVMGGLAACAAIRAWERSRGAHVPIVAMTAHAMQGDEERCLAAGMDDYISKPIDIDRLVSVLGKIAPSAKSPVAEAATPAPTEAEVDIDLALSRVGNDRKLMSDVVGLFMAQCPKAIAEMEGALAAGDSERLYQAAHKFKGSAGSIAAQRAAELALALEKAGRGGDLQTATEIFARLKGSTEQLQLQLAEIRQSLLAGATRA